MLDDSQLSIVFSKAPTLIRLGFLSVNRQHIPKIFAFVSFLICNFQTIELLLNNASLYLDLPSDKGSTIIEAYLQLFSFSHRFSYTNRTPIFIWGGIMLAYCLHFLVLFFYLSIKLKTRSVIPDYIQQYWSIMNYFHPLILFYPIHTFNIRVIHAYRLGTFTDSISGQVMFLFYANVIINFCLAFGSTRFFYVVIKTKDLLSCKNNSIRTNDILSKAFIPVLWIFSEDSDFIHTFTLVVALLDCFSRDFALFYYLPYHSLQMLEISALMQGATTALSLVTLTGKILSNTKLDLDQYFVHVAWIIIIPFGAKLYHAFLRRLFQYVISAGKSKMSVHYALLQMSLFNNLPKAKIPPNSDTRIFNMPYMIYHALISQIEGHEDYAEINFKGGKAEILKLIKGFYIWIVAQNPKSHVAKLTLAYHYVKKESAYLLANNLIEEVLNDAPSFSILVSLSLIRFELQKKNFLEYSQKGDNSNQSLNLLHYVQVNSLNDQFKKQVKHQIRKQLEFWENFSSNKPDMGFLTELATTIDQEKKDVHKVWKELAKTRPSTFYSPPLVYGMYTSLANNDAVEGEKFLKDYHAGMQKTKRLMEVDDLNNDTMMAEDTVQILMSGSRTKIGYILDCSANISEVYGWKKEFLTKQPIITIMPPYYQHKHDRFLMNHYNTGKTKLLNNTSLLPVVGSDGYIRPSRVHIKMHPFVEQGISYVAVLRTIKEPKRMVLIRRDGSIDGMSKNFAADMNIPSKKSIMSIFNLCPEFRFINKVFNKKALKVIEDSSPNLSESDSSVTSRNRLGGDFADLVDNNRSNENESSSYNFSQKRGRSISEKSPINSMEIETQAQAIYDSFTTGSKLTFYPQTTHVVNGNKIKLFANKKSSEPPFQPISYNVQIITRIHGKEFIKVVYLDRIINENDIDNLNSDDDEQFKHIRKHKQTDLLALSGLVSSSRPLMSPPSQEPGIIKIDVAENTESENNTSRIMTIPEEFTNNEVPMKTPDLTSSKKSRFSPKANKDSSGIIKDRHHTLKSEEHGTEPHQEENLLRKKLNKLKNKLDHQLAMEIHRQEGSVASSYLSRGKKVQGLILRALNMRTYKKSAIMFCLGFLLFVLAVLILQTFESLNILQTFNNVTSKTDVIGNGVFRLSALIHLALYARVFYASIELSGFQNLTVASSQDLTSELKYFSDTTNQLNSLLLQQVGQISQKYQRIFYQKDIRVYENSSLIGYYSNFEATTLLLGHVTRFLSQQTSSNYTSTDLEGLEFFLNNTFNDFLVSSETTTGLLVADLNDTLHSTDRDTLIIYGFILASCVVFLAHVLKYFHTVTKDSNRFIEVFFRLSLRDATEIKLILQNFINSLDSSIHDLEDINEKHDPRDLAKNEKSTTTGKVKFRRPSTEGLLKKQIIAFMRILPIYMILIACTLGYYLITNNILTQIKEQEVQISNSLNTLYRQNLLITEFIELVATNSTAYVRNKPIEESMLSDLGSIKSIGYIIDQFRDSNGELTAREQAVFFDFPCEDFAYYITDMSETIVSSCIALSSGTGKISFTAVTSLLYTDISTYYSQFLESSRTAEDLSENLQSTSAEFQYLALVAPAMCQILYDSTIEDFGRQVDNARLIAIYFSIFMIVGMGISAILVWIFVIKKIVDLEIYYKMMLKLVPVPSILANQHLKQYLLRNSNNLLDSVRSFL